MFFILLINNNINYYNTYSFLDFNEIQLFYEVEFFKKKNDF